MTCSNAYGSQVYLRIALELYLKRLVVGGIERVYEIGRIFRNEGADATHNPEFTMLEAYQAYGDYNTIGELTRELVQGAAVAALGSTVIQRADGSEYDIGGDWPMVTVYDAISAASGQEVTADTAEAKLRDFCERLGVPAAPGWPRGQIVLEMYERLVEKRTVQPTFYRDFPVEVSPLVRQHIEDDYVAAVAGAPYVSLHQASARWAVIRSVSKVLGPDLRVAPLAGDALTISQVEGRQLLGSGWVSHLLQQTAANLWQSPATRELLARAAALRDVMRTTSATYTG